MLDPKDVESVVNKSDMVLDVLNKRSKVVFKVPLVRIRVAFFGYQYVWGELNRAKLTSELLDLGFDNLTLTLIIEGIIHLKRKVTQWKESPKRITDPLELARMETQVKKRVRFNTARGKF